jgi:hypothetical protein
MDTLMKRKKKPPFFEEVEAKPKRCEGCGSVARVTSVTCSTGLTRRQYCDGCIIRLPSTGRFVPTAEQREAAETRLASNGAVQAVSEERALRHLWVGRAHLRPGRLT